MNAAQYLWASLQPKRALQAAGQRGWGIVWHPRQDNLTTSTSLAASATAQPRTRSYDHGRADTKEDSLYRPALVGRGHAAARRSRLLDCNEPRRPRYCPPRLAKRLFV